MRLVKHSNPDAMPSMWPPDDQGRSVEYGDDGAPRGGAIAGLCFALGAMLVVGIVLVVWGSS